MLQWTLQNEILSSQNRNRFSGIELWVKSIVARSSCSQLNVRIELYNHSSKHTSNKSLSLLGYYVAANISIDIQVLKRECASDWSIQIGCHTDHLWVSILYVADNPFSFLPSILGYHKSTTSGADSSKKILATRTLSDVFTSWWSSISAKFNQF